MTEIICTIDNCFYWEDNKCNADIIKVSSINGNPELRNKKNEDNTNNNEMNNLADMKDDIGDYWFMKRKNDNMETMGTMKNIGNGEGSETLNNKRQEIEAGQLGKKPVTSIQTECDTFKPKNI